MYVFGNDTAMRGCFKSFNLMQGQKGAYLQFPDTEAPYPNNGSPIIAGRGQPVLNSALITAINVTQREKYQLVECFGDVVHTYGFGYNAMASNVEVTMALFLVGSGGEDLSGEFRNAISTRYGYNRLSKNPEYVTLTIGRTVLSGFLVGMRSSTLDPQHNLQAVTYTLALVEAQ